MTVAADRPKPYDRQFYLGQQERSLLSARVVLERMFALLKPAKVLDVGCGVGTWLRAAVELGATQVLGVDGGHVDQSMLQIDPANFRSVDLAVDRLDTLCSSSSHGRFDLSMCLEVAEHLPFERAPSLVDDLVSTADAILFSAAVPYQYGVDHINEQWPEFWAMHFRSRGYLCFDFLREAIWNHAEVEWWYAQNLLVFAREGSETARRLMRHAPPVSKPLARVHPENFLANVLGLHRRHRLAALAEEQADYRSVVRAYAAGLTTIPPLEAIARAKSSAAGSGTAFPNTRTELSEPEKEIAALRSTLEDERQHLQAKVNAMAARISVVLARGNTESLRAARLSADVERLEARIAALNAELEAAVVERNQVTARLHAVLSSTVWAAAAALARIASRLPPAVRRVVRGGAKLAWWTVTLKLRARLAARHQAQNAALSAPPPTEQAPVADQPQLQQAEGHLANIAPSTIALALERISRLSVFDRDEYLRMHADVAQSDHSAARHALLHGAWESRPLWKRERVARTLAQLSVVEPDAHQSMVPADIESVARGLPEVGIYVSSLGNLFMRDIALDLVRDLTEVGVNVKLHDETESPDQRPGVCVFVAPHEFFLLGEGKRWVRDDVIREAFLYTTEQIQTRWFAATLPFVLMARGVFDIEQQTARLFSEASIPALHLEPSAPPTAQLLEPADEAHSLLLSLPKAARAPASIHTPFTDRPIDLCFFGAETASREAFFTRHAKFLADYTAFFHYRRAAGPISHGSEDSALVRIAGHVSGHAKISLNLHREEFGYFEWHRIVRLAMCGGSVVVSEPCLPHPIYKPGTHFFEASARHIPELIEWLVHSKDGRVRAEQCRANAVTALQNRASPLETGKRMVAFLSQFGK